MRTSDAMTIIRRSWVTLAASVLLGLGSGALVVVCAADSQMYSEALTPVRKAG